VSVRSPVPARQNPSEDEAVEPVGHEIQFRSDLYAGSAEDYELFRRPYPQQLLSLLVQKAEVSGRGRLLDLACGTGQVAFGLCRHFSEVWAVDQEADMVRVGSSKAKESGISNIQWENCAAQDLAAAAGSFELITIGNAFHRLPRQLIATKAFGWLRGGGYLALLWGGSPWQETQGWQQAVLATYERWRAVVGGGDRVPAGWAQARTVPPDVEVLRAADFEVRGRFTVPASLEWTFTSLVGYVYSTSGLPRSLLGDNARGFEAELRSQLAEAAGGEPYLQQTEFACDLGRRP
jgi:SAM-dependent methyltransferase